MSDVQNAINIVRLAITAAKTLSDAMDVAKKNLDTGTVKLEEMLKEIEKERGAMHTQLNKDRKEADDTFDKKFDGSKDD